MKKIIYLFTLLNFAFSLLGCVSQSQINRLRPLANPQSFINYLDSHSDEKKNVEWFGSTYDFTKNRSFYKKGKESSNFLGTCFFSTERGDETQELPSNFWRLITITIIYPVSNGFFSKSYYRYFCRYSWSI